MTLRDSYHRDRTFLRIITVATAVLLIGAVVITILIANAISNRKSAEKSDAQLEKAEISLDQACAVIEQQLHVDCPSPNTTDRPIPIPGPRGEKGDRGEMGPQGLPGKDSTVPGPPGKDSTVPGPPGADGATGPAGQDGKDGRDGVDGKDGSPAATQTFLMPDGTTLICTRDPSPDDAPTYTCKGATP